MAFGGMQSAAAEWLTAEEAAAHLKVKRRTLLLWVRQKKALGYPLSGVKRKIWRFRKVDLDSMLLAPNESVVSSQSPSVLITKGEGK
jgi:excisionase family DNA binding protein